MSPAFVLNDNSFEVGDFLDGDHWRRFSADAKHCSQRKSLDVDLTIPTFFASMLSPGSDDGQSICQRFGDSPRLIPLFQIFQGKLERLKLLKDMLCLWSH